MLAIKYPKCARREVDRFGRVLLLAERKARDRPLRILTERFLDLFPVGEMADIAADLLCRCSEARDGICHD